LSREAQSGRERDLPRLPSFRGDLPETAFRAIDQVLSLRRPAQAEGRDGRVRGQFAGLASREIVDPDPVGKVLVPDKIRDAPAVGRIAGRPDLGLRRGQEFGFPPAGPDFPKASPGMRVMIRRPVHERQDASVRRPGGIGDPAGKRPFDLHFRRVRSPGLVDNHGLSVTNEDDLPLDQRTGEKAVVARVPFRRGELRQASSFPSREIHRRQSPTVGPGFPKDDPSAARGESGIEMLAILQDGVREGLGLASLGRERPDLAQEVEHDRSAVRREVEGQLRAFMSLDRDHVCLLDGGARMDIEKREGRQGAHNASPGEPYFS